MSCTAMNRRIEMIDAEKNLMLVRGSVPGSRPSARYAAAIAVEGGGIVPSLGGRVWVRATGADPLTLWITGWSPAVRERFEWPGEEGDGGGLVLTKLRAHAVMRFLADRGVAVINSHRLRARNAYLCAEAFTVRGLEAFDGAFADVGRQPVKKPLGPRVSVMAEAPLLTQPDKEDLAACAEPHLRLVVFRHARDADVRFQREARNEVLREPRRLHLAGGCC